MESLQVGKQMLIFFLLLHITECFRIVEFTCLENNKFTMYCRGILFFILYCKGLFSFFPSFFISIFLSFFLCLFFFFFLPFVLFSLLIYYSLSFSITNKIKTFFFSFESLHSNILTGQVIMTF